MSDDTIKIFISRWKQSGGYEMANSQLFLNDLCQILDLPTPSPASPSTEENKYTFERKVTFHHADGTTSRGRMDLYRRGAFVLESKQGQNLQNDPDGLKKLTKSKQPTSKAVTRDTRKWSETMEKAKRQAENYVRALPVSEGRPPFIIIADVGHCFDIYAEFSCTGGTYTPFPDIRSSE